MRFKGLLFFLLLIEASANDCRKAISALVLEHSKVELSTLMASSEKDAMLFFQSLISSSDLIHGELERGDYLAATQSLVKLTKKGGMPPSKVPGIVLALTNGAVREPSSVTTHYGELMSADDESFMIQKLNGEAAPPTLRAGGIEERAATEVTPELAMRWKNSELFYADMIAAHKVTPEFNRAYSYINGDDSPEKVLRERYSSSSADLYNLIYDTQKSNNFGDSLQLTLALMHACAMGDKNLSIELIARQESFRRFEGNNIAELWKQVHTAVRDTKLKESLQGLRIKGR